MTEVSTPKGEVTPEQITAAALGEEGELARVGHGIDRNTRLAMQLKLERQLADQLRRYYETESSLTLTSQQRLAILLGQKSDEKEDQGIRPIFLIGSLVLTVAMAAILVVFTGPFELWREPLSRGDGVRFAPAPISKSRAEDTKAFDQGDGAVTKRGRHFIFLIDGSTSMKSPEKLPLFRKVLKMIAQKQELTTHYSFVVYGNGVEILLERTPWEQEEVIGAALDMVGSEFTNAEQLSGLEVAYSLAERSLSESSMIDLVLVTDGDFALMDSPLATEALVAEKWQKLGVRFHTFAFGEPAQADSSAAPLVQVGKGRFGRIQSLDDAVRIMLPALVIE